MKSTLMRSRHLPLVVAVLGASVCVAWQVRAESQTFSITQLLHHAIAAYENKKPFESALLAGQAYDQLWQQAPLSVRDVAIVESPAQYFGDVKRRANAHFREGELLHVYIEPLFFRYRRAGDVFEAELEIDMAITDASGKVTLDKKQLPLARLGAAKPVHDVFGMLNITLNDAPAGKYSIQFRLRDVIGKMVVPFKVDIEIEN